MLQVLVCSSQDDWKGSQVKGFGPNHVIERFSVSLALKRWSKKVLFNNSFDSESYLSVDIRIENIKSLCSKILL